MTGLPQQSSQPHLQHSVALARVESAAPVLDADRIESIDVLRGLAVLGILVMNAQAFFMPGAAYMNPTAFGDLSGPNYWVWYLGHVLADQKFMTIFSMLFGAGIVLMTSRAEARTGHSAGVHYRRMGWLILFGMMHAYLLWYGDILFTYGLCGLLAWVFRKLHPAILIPVGLVTVSVASLISVGFGLTLSMAPPEALEGMRTSWTPNAEELAAEIQAYKGSWLDQMSQRVPTSIFFQTFLFMTWAAWRAGGLMLIGMGLYKLGVFSARRSAAFYWFWIVLALLIGAPVVMWGVRENTRHNWDLAYSFFFGVEWNYWGSLLVSMGWVGVTMLACKTKLANSALRPLAAVGRMAFTNYLMQTVIFTTIAYGHGFGMFGTLERIEQIGIVAGVWIAQLVISPIWLRFFEFGPAEWLWRSLTYWELQPMLKRSAQPAVTA